MSQPSDLAAAITDYMNSLYATVTDPAQAIPLFTSLTQVDLQAVLGSDAISNAQATVQSSIYDLWRRTAVTILAQASAAYQPTSYNDAEDVRMAVANVIDSEITIAGDQGEDDTFLALKQLRAAVVQDLTVRGAALAPLTTFTFGENLPALALAYQIYQDITRTDQLTAFGNSPHPAFMPVSFQALAA